MNFGSIRRNFCVFIFVGSTLVIPLMLQVNVAKAAGTNQINVPETQTGASMMLLAEKGSKEGDMTDRDKLTEEEGKYLLEAARKSVENQLLNREKANESDVDLPTKFHERRGTFVTLTIHGNLRGCIGHIVPQESLIEGIRVNAINAAFRDPRFRPIRRKEWKSVKIEVSVLTEPKPLAYIDGNDLLRKLRPGTDGLIIKKGYCQATFLPQVWEQLPKKQEFLNHLCLKAGLDGDAWKEGNLEVSTYQVQAFEE
jgi:AmmeMemoRadiSam system protein A